MSIYLLETWIVEPQHEEGHEALWRQFVDYMSRNRDLFKGIVSMKLYRRLSAPGSPTHAQVIEFSSMEDKLALDERVVKDKTCFEFRRSLSQFKDSKTASEVLCQPFLEYR
jgi:hypothetical protein